LIHKQNLIDEGIDWLNSYPEEKAEYKSAIQNLKKRNKESLKSCVSNCYLVVEGLSRKILGNTANLDRNIEALLKKINLFGNWKSIIKNYYTLLNEYGRHASEKRKDIEENEVESILYFTGLLVRLIANSLSNRA